MSVTETVLTFVVVPAAVVLLIFGLVYAGNGRRAKRYRPGRPFEFVPVWFLSAPKQLAGDAGDAGARALPQEAPREQLPGRAAGEPAEGPLLAAQPESAQHVVGGASDRW